VTNQNSGTVSVIDGTLNKLIDAVTVGEFPRRVVVNQETNTVYVTNQLSETVSVIDGSKNTVIDTIDVPEPFEMAINSIQNKVYVTYFGTGILSIIDESLIEDESSAQLYVLLGIASAAIVGVVIAIIIHKKQVRIRSEHQ
ncbi:MAG: YncE family protein, partial [Thaumarchaeota archaeon]|nr:YncE family protein [Nitrososphaerota archaeon]